jgi:transposase
MMVWTRPLLNGIEERAKMRVVLSFNKRRRVMKDFTVIGVDIAKNVFQIHGADSLGKRLLTKRLSRENFLPFMGTLPRCLVGIEACSGAHYWAKELIKLGFEVKLMSPLKVKKYADTHQKNDARDAAACCEAVTRAAMRFVSVKNDVQLDIQSMHRVRSYYIKQRTALMNMMRGLLAESGVAIAKGQAHLTSKLVALLDDECERLRPAEKSLFRRLKTELEKMEEEIAHHTSRLEKCAKEDEACRRLQTIDGIGPLSATAVVAKIGNGSEFQKGRDLSAFLGLVPRQSSSGNKQVLGSITKHGDRYIRQLLVHGGRACVQAASRMNKNTGTFYKNDPHSAWIRNLTSKVGVNKASVAVANKNARVIVAMLKNKTIFHPELAHGQENVGI